MFLTWFQKSVHYRKVTVVMTFRLAGKKWTGRKHREETISWGRIQVSCEDNETDHKGQKATGYIHSLGLHSLLSTFIRYKLEIVSGFSHPSPHTLSSMHLAVQHVHTQSHTHAHEECIFFKYSQPTFVWADIIICFLRHLFSMNPVQMQV